MDLSIDRSIYLSVCLSICQSVCLSVCLSICLSVCLSIRLLVNPFQALYRSFSLLPYPSLSLSLLRSPSLPLFFFLSLSLCCLSTWKEAILQDFFQKWRLAGPKQSNSARLVQKNDKNDEILRDVLHFWNWQLRGCGVFTMFTSKYAARYSGVHCLNSSTSKSAPTMKCFDHLYFEDPGSVLRATTLFRQLHFQKCSDVEVFFRILTSKCASRHSGVQFLVSHPTRWLHFSEPTFRPFGATKHWKNTMIPVFRNFLPFGTSWSSFYWLSLFFYFFLFCHLCCFICPYCRKCYFKTFFDWSKMQQSTNPIIRWEFNSHPAIR